MSRVNNLYRIGLNVPDLNAAGIFYNSCWAMRPSGSDAEELRFRSAETEHSDLLLFGATEASLNHIGFAVDSIDDLNQILRTVDAAGYTVVQNPQNGKRPDELLVAVISDVDGNRVELIVPRRISNAEEVSPQQGPKKIGHVVLWTPQERLTEQEKFYSLLGLAVTDRTHIGMSFLRCSLTHHSLALAKNSQQRTGFQHVAYDVGSIDDVMRNLARLREKGVPCIWGVGRHGPGNNIFSYYRDPAGNVVEYYGDMEVVDRLEVESPVFWGPEHKGDIWGVSGPPPDAFRG